MRRLFARSFFLISCAALFSCATGQLNTHQTSYKTGLLPGPYILLVYGQSFEGSYERVVFMYPEGGQYRFVPYIPVSGFQTIKNVPADEALKRANKILKNRDIRRLRIKQILHNGMAIGYEIKAALVPPTFSNEDFLEITYFLKGNDVRIQIMPSPFFIGLLISG